MERIKVESSNVVSIGYDEEKETLEVEFKGGSVYHYYHVDKDTHSEFMKDESHGRFLRKVIIPNFPCVQIEQKKEVQNEINSSIALESN